MPKASSTIRPLPLVALFLAWLVPGAGHVYLGRTWRGVVMFVAIAATFWSGVAIGGVMTVDYENQRWWFAAQMLTGVHGLIGWRQQDRIYRDLAADAGVGVPPPRGTARRLDWESRLDARLAKEGVALAAPADTVARAYTGVAGLLNLMCVFDAVMLALLAAAAKRAAQQPHKEDT